MDKVHVHRRLSGGTIATYNGMFVKETRQDGTMLLTFRSGSGFIPDAKPSEVHPGWIEMPIETDSKCPLCGEDT